MKEMNPDQHNTRLGALLCESRPTPSLPPRFQEGVWRRIERAGTAGSSTASPRWLEAVVMWVLRPRFALAGVLVLLLAGATLGIQQGARAARHEAQDRYLATVAPNALR